MLHSRILADAVSTDPSCAPLADDVERHLETICIVVDAALVDAVEIFHARPELRLLPVVDQSGRPLGALYESDMRRILFNPFGHALLKNPSFGGQLRTQIRACPVVEVGMAMDGLLECYAAHGDGCEGLIFTRSGRFRGVMGHQTMLRMTAARDAEVAAKRAIRFAAIERESNDFRDEATALAGELTVVSRHLSEMARQMAARASSNGEQSSMVAAAAAQVARNMDEIVGRTRWLADGFVEVEQQMRATKVGSADAVSTVARSASQTRMLNDAADEIVDVTTVIGGIARKTTMLAINASIEAARAGSAGRGFAVVASEVKALASQTQKAAASISHRIGAIRVAIEHVSAAHGGMEKAIGAVDSLSSSVVDVLGEQGQTTRTIAENVDEAGKATDHIRDRAGEIQGNSVAAAETADAIRETATAIGARADGLERRVARFVEFVRAV